MKEVRAEMKNMQLCEERELYPFRHVSSTYHHLLHQLHTRMQPLLSPLTTSSGDSCCPEFPIPAWAVDLTFALQFTSFFILTTASETESRNTCRGRREGERERGREGERERERERGREGEGERERGRWRK